MEIKYNKYTRNILALIIFSLIYFFEELKLLTGQRTAPNIFIGGKHLGRFDGKRTEEYYSFTRFRLCVGTDTV
jgi:glutaredoxin